MAKTIMLWAFWRYDLYPYVLGSKVTSTNNDGTVCCEGYGNSKIHPRILVPGNPGKQLYDELRALRAQRRAEETELEKTYCVKAVQAFQARGISVADFPPLAKSEKED